MGVLETVLVILVVVWTLIFVIIAVALVLLFKQVKKAVDKVNNILQAGEDVAAGVYAVSKMATSGAAAFLSGNKKEIAKKLLTKSSKLK